VVDRTAGRRPGCVDQRPVRCLLHVVNGVHGSRKLPNVGKRVRAGRGLLRIEETRMGRIHYEPTSSDASGIQPDHARDRSWPVCNCVAMCVGDYRSRGCCGCSMQPSWPPRALNRDSAETGGEPRAGGRVVRRRRFLGRTSSGPRVRTACLSSSVRGLHTPPGCAPQRPSRNASLPRRAATREPGVTALRLPLSRLTRDGVSQTRGVPMRRP
jgi:hypothetical protein